MHLVCTFSSLPTRYSAHKVLVVTCTLCALWSPVHLKCTQRACHSMHLLCTCGVAWQNASRTRCTQGACHSMHLLCTQNLNARNTWPIATGPHPWARGVARPRGAFRGSGLGRAGVAFGAPKFQTTKRVRTTFSDTRGVGV